MPVVKGLWDSGSMAGTKGRLLVATPLLNDPNFERTVVLMLEDNEEGALGLVLNRPSPLEISDPLPDWAGLSAPPPVVFVGGPVSRSSVIALARSDRPDISEDAWTSVLGPIGVLDLTADTALMQAMVGDVRVFAGYAGWGAEQLVDEIAEGAWFVVEAVPSDAITDDPERLWRDVVRRQPPPIRNFADYPLDLSAN